MIKWPDAPQIDLSKVSMEVLWILKRAKNWWRCWGNFPITFGATREWCKYLPHPTWNVFVNFPDDDLVFVLFSVPSIRQVDEPPYMVGTHNMP